MTTPTTPSPRVRPRASRLPYLTLAALAAVVTVCLVVGAYAALVGGSAARAGSGPGGLGGVPQLALLAIAGPLGLASAVASRRRPARALLVLAGPLVVAFGYFFISHTVDPCTTGMWDLDTTVGGAPGCEYAGGYLGISGRFHLLQHGLVGALLVGAYATVLLLGDRRAARHHGPISRTVTASQGAARELDARGRRRTGV